MTVAVEIQDVSKRFRKHSEPAKTLKERLLTLRSSTVEDFHALRDIDFEIRMGETFGILGHNGSGKSTLLKCIAGTIRPSTGSVKVRGTLSALLELGAGFHPDLTGRENIFLNGSILGFSKARIERIFDEIVDFSGLEGFIDTQVKHYSSGMYARLGFAVAVNLEPDVLLIDEVLAVGDEAFQRKCIERVRGFQADGRTICLVTHSPEQVRDLCDRALVLDHGNLLHVGDVNEAVSIYRRSLDPYADPEPETGSASADDADESAGSEAAATALDLSESGSPSPVKIVETWIDAPPEERIAHRPGDEVAVGMRFTAPKDLFVRARLQIHSHDGVHIVNISGWDISGHDIGPTETTNDVRFIIDDLPLMDGHYLITLVLQDSNETVEYDRQEQELSFDVLSGGPVLGRVVMKFRIESLSGQPAPASR